MLPFKLNEDIDLTKATHLGKTPLDLTLTREKCSQLLAQELIKRTNSD